MTLVYLDNDNARRDELALHAVRIDGTWNGFLVPVVTAAELRRFIDANGKWDASLITESDGELAIDWADDDVEAWRSVGTDDDGNALYALDGWTWSTAP